MPWGWRLHQKPCKPYPNTFNSTLMERQWLAGNPDPIGSLSRAVCRGKCDLTTQREQPSQLSITMSWVQKHEASDRELWQQGDAL